MCFSPQRRAIFQHLNFKKWSEPDVFCTFSLGNVLLATAACNFSTSQLQKVVRSWHVLYIFTWKCASRYSGVQFLISPLTTWLRTRRFNEPTFRLTRRTNHWKNIAFRDFSNIWRGCIFFLLTFAQLHLLSSDFTSSHLLFNSPYCRKFTTPYYKVPVVPHKAVAEFSRIGNYRRDWLLWVTDGRAKTLMGQTVQLCNWLTDWLSNWLSD